MTRCRAACAGTSARVYSENAGAALEAARPALGIEAELETAAAAPLAPLADDGRRRRDVNAFLAPFVEAKATALGAGS